MADSWLPRLGQYCAVLSPSEIRTWVLEEVVNNWTDRMHFVTISRGGHMPKIIFKKQMALNSIFQKNKILKDSINS